MTLLWSAKNNAFFPSDMIETYKAAGWELDDAVEATEDMMAYQGTAPAGKIRTSGDDGLPTWSDIPAPTPEESQAMAAATKANLKSVADSEVSWRQDAVDGGIATEEETSALSEWKKYRVLLMRVDTSKAPDIEWPAQPALT